MSPTILITRPREDAERLAQKLKARGFDIMIEPMLTIEFVDDPTFDARGAQAILLTSANGARALGRTEASRDIPVFTVGERTAEAARTEGFRQVEPGGGDVKALAGLVAAQLDPAKGPVIHVSGRDIAGDLEGALTARAFTYRRHVLYKARAAGDFSASLKAALARDALAGVVFYSARTAATFVMLAKRAGLAARLGRMKAICLSEAVAEAARDATWARVQVTSQPEEEASIA
jgi:uroporphyrinogen-III synthase